MKTKNKIFVCYISMFLVVVIPFIVMCLVNRKEWFNYNKTEGYRVTIGFVISFIVFILCLFKVMPKATWIWSLVIGIVFYLLSSIMKDIYTMALVESIGLFIYWLVDIKKKDLILQYDYEKQAQANANALNIVKNNQFKQKKKIEEVGNV